jgi:uncharacterized protein YjbJ (UPF0337 family)
MRIATIGLSARLASCKEVKMNQDRVEGNWKQLKGKVRQQWGKLTDDDFDQIMGDRQMLAGKIQELYGISKEEAEKQVRQFNDKHKDIYNG